MADYSILKAAIAAYVKDRTGLDTIDGDGLQETLLAIVNSIGVGYVFMGVADLTTNPGTPDQRVWYLASTAGIYANFNNIVLNQYEIAVLKWDTEWHKEVIPDIPSKSQIDERLDEQDAEIDLRMDAQDGRLDGQDARLDGQDEEIADFKEAVQNQVDNYPMITINGNVTNAPDEEDITSVEENGSDVLKFKNRSAVDGMGYVILRKGGDNTFANQVTAANTIYEIRYDFDLGGASVTIPAGCVLKFVGGSVDNGTLIGQSTAIVSSCCCFKSRILFGGVWKIASINLLWFDVKQDDAGYDNAPYLGQAMRLQRVALSKIVIPGGVYYFLSSIKISEEISVVIEGTNNYTGIYDYDLRYKRTVLFVTADALFESTNTENTTTIYGSVSHLMIVGSTNEQGFCTLIPFKNFNLRHFVIDGCDISNVDAVVLGRVVNVSRISNNKIVCQSLIRINPDFVTSSQSSLNALVDSQICGNYINGKLNNGNGYTRMIVGRVSYSRITNNFIDFFKYLFYWDYDQTKSPIQDMVLFDNNLIDCTYSFTNAKVLEALVFNGNIIGNCGWNTGGATASWQAALDKENYQDVEGKAWCFFRLLTFKNSVITSNYFQRGDYFFVSLAAFSASNIIVKNNEFDGKLKIYINYVSQYSDSEIQGVNIKSDLTEGISEFIQFDSDVVVEKTKGQALNAYKTIGGIPEHYYSVSPVNPVYHSWLNLNYYLENDRWFTILDNPNLELRFHNNEPYIYNTQRTSAICCKSTELAALKSEGIAAEGIVILLYDVGVYIRYSGPSVARLRGDIFVGPETIQNVLGNTSYLVSSYPVTPFINQTVAHDTDGVKRWNGTAWVDATLKFFFTPKHGTTRPVKSLVISSMEPFYDESLNPSRPIWHNGTAWVDATGTPV